MKLEDVLSCSSTNRHSFFQLEKFVLDKEPTHQAKLQCCINELRSKKTEMDSINLEIEDLKDKNLLLEREIGMDEIKTRMTKRRIQQNVNSINRLTNRIENLQEEVDFFVSKFEKLIAIEPLKDWDDFEVQVEYWDAKISKELTYRLLMQLPIDMELIKTALCLPKGSQAKKTVAGLLQKQHEKLLQV